LSNLKDKRSANEGRHRRRRGDDKDDDDESFKTIFLV